MQHVRSTVPSVRLALLHLLVLIPTPYNLYPQPETWHPTPWCSSSESLCQPRTPQSIYTWHDSFICDMTRLHLYVTWLCQYVCVWYCTHTHIHCRKLVPWLSHTHVQIQLHTHNLFLSLSLSLSHSLSSTHTQAHTHTPTHTLSLFLSFSLSLSLSLSQTHIKTNIDWWLLLSFETVV